MSDDHLHPAIRPVALILQSLYARIVRVRGAAEPPAAALAPAADVAPPAGPSIDLDFTPQPEIFELIDPAALLVEADRTARAEPTTVAEARDLIRDPHAALEAPEMHRHVAWLVAGADLRHRRACAAPGGRTVA